jgi:hypothetical protein
VNNHLLISVLDLLIHRNEQLKALTGRQIVRFAILGDRHALHQFHHEERPPGFSGASIKHAGDVLDDFGNRRPVDANGRAGGGLKHLINRAFRRGSRRAS